MFEVLTNPSTLLCLGVIFILISVLFFYFKRNFSLLERAQMEQARVLQSFITNMEMTQHMALNRASNVDNHNLLNGTQYMRQPDRIDVSDDSDTDSDDESDADADDESDADSDSDDTSDSDDETKNNENVSIISNSIPIIEVDEFKNNMNDNIKVIQLQDNTLEESHPEILEINVLNNSDDDFNVDDDSDDMSIDDSNQSLSEEEQQQVEEVKNEKIPLADFKTLSVQTLRQIAEDGGLIHKGEKKTKKELLTLLETTKK